MKKVLSLVLIIVMVLSLALTGCSNKEPAETSTLAGTSESSGTQKPVKKQELKLGCSAPDSTAIVQGAKYFADLVRERTDGMLDIKVYPNDQLSQGSLSKGIELVINGVTDFDLHSNIIYSIMNEKFGVLSLPFLIPDYETADKVLDGKGGEMYNQMLKDIGLVGIGFMDNGFRQLTNNVRSVETPEDMKGMKLRVPGMKMYISLYKALGADPISMNFAEVFTALQQGTIDGQENPVDTIYSAKLYEVQDYITLWNYSYDAYVFTVNQEKWDTFDAETQQIIKDAAKEACVWQKKLNREQESKEIQEFEAAGVKVNELTKEQKAKFREVVQPVYDEYEPIMGKDTIDSFSLQ